MTTKTELYRKADLIIEKVDLSYKTVYNVIKGDSLFPMRREVVAYSSYPRDNKKWLLNICRTRLKKRHEARLKILQQLNWYDNQIVEWEKRLLEVEC